MPAITSYLHTALDKQVRRESVDLCLQAIRKLQKKYPKLDGIACTGVSGLLIAPILAHALDLALVVVRKDNDGAHSIHKVEGDECSHFLIVDDFIASGSTIHNILDRLRQSEWRRAKCVGIVTYGYGSWCEESFGGKYPITTIRGNAIGDANREGILDAQDETDTFISTGY